MKLPKIFELPPPSHLPVSWLWGVFASQLQPVLLRHDLAARFSAGVMIFCGFRFQIIMVSLSSSPRSTNNQKKTAWNITGFGLPQQIFDTPPKKGWFLVYPGIFQQIYGGISGRSVLYFKVFRRIFHGFPWGGALGNPPWDLPTWCLKWWVDANLSWDSDHLQLIELLNRSIWKKIMVTIKLDQPFSDQSEGTNRTNELSNQHSVLMGFVSPPILLTKVLGDQSQLGKEKTTHQSFRKAKVSPEKSFLHPSVSI